MNEEPKAAVVISASSDIGTAMSRRWLARDWPVIGTYRTPSATAEELSRLGMAMVCCDLSDRTSVRSACHVLREACPAWDVLVLCPGSQEPVGPFEACDFEEWEASVRVNFTAQMRIVHELLPCRTTRPHSSPCVLFFAGGGTNNATVNYSAYTVSKIALIKMCELLDAEIDDARFVIVGPGWVKTKIHAATLRAADKAGKNYHRTTEKLAGDECTPMVTVLDCLDWVIQAPSRVVGGRNLSVVFDEWGSSALEQQLTAEPNMYKLRRCGNEWESRKQ